ncbi:MaoC/PaaZ C-terminal domain-containing protein [Micromonospora rubida]|uniref:MaoC/PaaZ C-terminal domain-containing protein n=1 Tax=Micromonospora rubida TaxID=2697657 RepID=A0ABW7SMU3_9ACTN
MPGRKLPAREFTVSRQDLVRYAGASGDFNPIHFSDHAATRSGLPGVIGHGMLTMALTARAVTEWIGDVAGVLDHETQFKLPLLVPDDGGVTLTVTATISDPDDAGHRQLVAEATTGATVVAVSRLTIRPAER